MYRAIPNASVEGAKSFRAAALAWIKEFENTWSRFKPDSLLSRINAGAGKQSFELNEVQEHVLKLCEHTYRFTNGLNDPTSFPLTLLWDQAAKEDRLPAEEEISETQKLVSWPSVEWGEGSVFLPERGMALEIGGFGKEYAVDQLIALAKQHEIPDVLVDLGRDRICQLHLTSGAFLHVVQVRQNGRGQDVTADHGKV